MNRPTTLKNTPVVNAEIPTLATLQNTKKLLPHHTPEYFVVEKHFLEQMLRPLIRTIFVDEEWYLNRYPDVRDSVQSGAVTSASDHFTRFGYLEQRLPYDIKVDEAWYLAQYPDVKASVRREDFATGKDHYEAFGFREGRLPHSNFAFKRR